jgi:hypothetical protein
VIEVSLIALRFAMLCLMVSMPCGYRSRANYEHWLSKRRLSLLTISRNQHSTAETAFALARIALLLSLFCFIMHSLLPMLLGESELW